MFNVLPLVSSNFLTILYKVFRVSNFKNYFLTVVYATGLPARSTLLLLHIYIYMFSLFLLGVISLLSQVSDYYFKADHDHLLTHYCPLDSPVITLSHLEFCCLYDFRRQVGGDSVTKKASIA
jgi:hypothetical protein